MSRVRLLFDEDLDRRILDGLKQRLPVAELATVVEVGLGAEHDSVILQWAATNRYIVVTHDVNTMTHHAYRQAATGQVLRGVIVVPQWLGVGAAIEDLSLIVGAGEAEEWENQITFLPLR
jgi:hypothetical protein